MHEIRLLLANTVALVWTGLAAAAGWAVAAAFAALFYRAGHPPVVARVGCALGMMAWLLVVFFVIFPMLLSVHLPYWVLAVFGAIVVLLLVVLLATRKGH
jgi:hypothetical protein